MLSDVHHKGQAQMISHMECKEISNGNNKGPKLLEKKSRRIVGTFVESKVGGRRETGGTGGGKWAREGIVVRTCIPES